MSVAIFPWICWMSVIAGAASAAGLSLHLWRHPQKMGVMNAVWPLCALFGSILVVWMYGRYGRGESGRTPDWVSGMKGTLHCGSGCTLGDLIAEGLVFVLPSVAVPFGWHWLFSDRTFPTWVLDCILAFGFGILFQFYAIAPMRGLGVREGLKAAIKADAASLAAWQVGMFGVMALFQFVLYPHLLGKKTDAADIEFWFAMQWAMVGGFITAYPVNRLLIAKGVKEAM